MNACVQHCDQDWNIVFAVAIWMYLSNIAFKADTCYLLLSYECMCPALRSNLELSICCWNMTAFVKFCSQGWSLLFSAAVCIECFVKHSFYGCSLQIAAVVCMCNIAIKAGSCNLLLAHEYICLPLVSSLVVFCLLLPYECLCQTLLSKLVLSFRCCQMDVFSKRCFQDWYLLFAAVGWMHLSDIACKADRCYLQLSPSAPSPASVELSFPRYQNWLDDHKEIENKNYTMIKFGDTFTAATRPLTLIAVKLNKF